MRLRRANQLSYGKYAIAGSKNAEYPIRCHGNDISSYVYTVWCIVHSIHVWLYTNDRSMDTIQQQKPVMSNKMIFSG